MNKRTQQSQDEIKIRRWIRKIIKEDAQKPSPVLLEQEGGLMDTFVTPFTDVFKVAVVGAKKILSAAVLNVQLLFSFTEESRLKAFGDYNTRKTKIDAEWKEAMASTDAYWNGEKGDMGTLAFMMAPGMAIGASLADSAVDAGIGTVEFAADAGIVPSSLQGMFDMEVAAQAPERGMVGSALHGLAKLFFIAGYSHKGPLLSEAEDDEKKKEDEKKGDPVKELDNIFKESGMQKKMDAEIRSLIDDRKAATEEIVKQITSQFEIVESLAAATDMKTFKEAIEKAKADVPEMAEGAGLDEVEAQIEVDKKKIMDDPEAKKEMIKALAEREGIKPEEGEDGEEKYPDIPDEKLIPEVEQAVFMKIKETLQGDLGEGVEELKESAIESIKFEGPNEDDRKIMSSVPLGQEMLKVIDDGVSAIESLGAAG